jgi:hypothetical protein
MIEGMAPDTYAKLGPDMEPTGEMRTIPASAIRINPAAQLRAGKPNPASAANGAKGGRPAKHEVGDVWKTPDGWKLQAPLGRLTYKTKRDAEAMRDAAKKIE